MKAPSPIAVIRSILGPEQADALLRGGVAPDSLARTVLEATAPADLAATLTAAGLEKAEPLSARTVLAVQNLVQLNQMRADRAVREAALGKAEALEKRSKNVRNWTRYEEGDPSKGPLKGSTIDRRQSRYMRGLGLDLDTESEMYQRDKDVAPTPKNNVLPHARTGEDLLTLEHEGAHALMTPPDKKMSRYFRWLHGQNKLERTTRHQRSGRGTRAQREAVEEAQVPGSKHEHIAQAMSPGIQRRSGVAPGAHRNFYPHDDLSPEEYQEIDKLRQDVHGRKAKGYLRRWDEGMRFDKEGVATPPTGIDAAINQRARIARRPPKMTSIPQHEDIPARTANIGGGPLASSVQAQLSARMHSQLPHQGETTPRRPPGQPLPLPKSEHAPKLPPDQHGIGPKHEPEEKIAPTKQLEPQVHQNRGAKRPPVAILKSEAAEWRFRPILRPEDAQDLDHAAAARSLSSGSAQEGEQQAYEEYSRQQRLDAMAHHFRQAGEAQKRGDRPTSDRHMLAYAGHARALGIDPAGHPPAEVGERIRQLAGKKAAFRGHPADRLA